MCPVEKKAVIIIRTNPGLTKEGFYKHLKVKLDDILFPEGAPRGVYYNYYTNRSN